MNKTYYRLRHLTKGQKLFWSWTLVWFALLVPVSLLWNAFQKAGATLGDVLFLSTSAWMLASTSGAVLWLLVKGIAEAKTRRTEEIYVLEE